MRKKSFTFAALLLCLLLALLVTGCNAGASSSSSSSSLSVPGPTGSVEGTSSSAGMAASKDADSQASFMPEEFTGSTMYMRFIMHYTSDGESVSQEGVVAQMDGQQVTQVEVEGMVVRIIMRNDGTVYVVSDSEQLAMNINAIGMDIPFETPEYVGDIYVGNGTGTVMGKELPYEEYHTDNVTIRYYVDGGDLAFITVDSGDDLVVMEILEISGTVDKTLFEIPANYQVIETMADFAALS